MPKLLLKMFFSKKQKTWHHHLLAKEKLFVPSVVSRGVSELWRRNIKLALGSDVAQSFGCHSLYVLNCYKLKVSISN